MKYFYALIFLLIGFNAIAQKADLVLTNGNIITLKQKGDRAQAIAISGDKIIAEGTAKTISKYIGKQTKVIDLKGKTVMPGFNDVHQHPAPVYTFDKPYATLKLDTVTSMKNLIALLKRKAAITPKGMLIRGVGYNETKLGGQPIRDSLDKATPDHPIIISHVSGHLSAANSMLMDMNGIEKILLIRPEVLLNVIQTANARMVFVRKLQLHISINQNRSNTRLSLQMPKKWKAIVCISTRFWQAV